MRGYLRSGADRPDQPLSKGDRLAAPMPARPRPPLPGPEYHVQVDFRAPLAYVFGWCTDYRPDDARLEHETYQRRIIERTERRVIFEDLEEVEDGWSWGRVSVDLRPPVDWHAERRGNRREVSVDYRLTELGPERTRLDFRLRRRTLVPEVRLSKSARERHYTKMWSNFRAALEADYRGTKGSRARRTSRRTVR